ncbi:MAG: hypothetical protein WCE63_07445 [Acidobacteriaceae bacterium]
MTFEHWLTIGIIFSGIVGPTLAVFIQFRISQPKGAKEPKQPQTSTQGKYGFSPKYLPVAVSTSCILYNIYLLVREFHATTPITRGSIVAISLIVSAILLSIVCLGAILVLAKVAYPLLNLSKETTVIIKGVLGITDNHEERLYKIEVAQFDKPAQEYLATLPEHPKARNTDI